MHFSFTKKGDILIYFDNAATSKQKPEIVVEAVVNALRSFGNASRGVYDETLDAQRVIFDTRVKLCELFNLDNPRQVVFTKNATEGLNVAINGLCENGTHVITSVMEHNSVLRPLNYLKSNKIIDINYIDVNEKGELLLENIEKIIKNNTKILVITHASNVTGNINNLEQIGLICKKHGILFIVDSSQTAGAFNIDIKRMNIDVLCFTGHKSLLSPQGTGGLCVNKDVYIKPFIVGGTGFDSYNSFQPDKMPTRLESGTQNAHSIAGLNAALEYLLTCGIESLTKKAQSLSSYFYNELKDIEGVKFYGNYTKEYRAPIVALNIFEEDSGVVSDILYREYGISTRAGAHCAPLMHKAMKTESQGMVRFSFSHSNTYDEVNIAIGAIKNIVNKLK